MITCYYFLSSLVIKSVFACRGRDFGIEINIRLLHYAQVNIFWSQSMMGLETVHSL